MAVARSSLMGTRVIVPSALRIKGACSVEAFSTVVQLFVALEPDATLLVPADAALMGCEIEGGTLVIEPGAVVAYCVLRCAFRGLEHLSDRHLITNVLMQSPPQVPDPGEGT